MKVILLPLLLSICFYPSNINGRVIFTEEETEEGSAYPTQNKLVHPTNEVETTKPEISSFFPTEHSEIGSQVISGSVVPAGFNDTQGRTFHTLSRLQHKVESKFNYLLFKLISPFFPPPPPEIAREPHYMGIKLTSLPEWLSGPYPLYYRNDEKATGFFNDNAQKSEDIIYEPSDSNYVVIKPAQGKPEYTPTSFSERVEKFVRHTIGKRSTDQQEPGTTRDSRTLYKFIPNFQENFGKLMKRIVGPLYGSGPIPNYNELYKSDLPASARPALKFTNIANLLPRIRERMNGEMSKIRQYFRGTPVQKQ